MTPTAAPPNRTRTLLLLLLTPVFLLLALAAGMSWRLERRVWKLGEELVAEAHALEVNAGRRLRPPHVDAPTPGTFAQALEPLMPELRAFRAADTLAEKTKATCQEVREGTRPLAELPQECREQLEHYRPLMHGVLRASRTELAGAPEGLRLFATSDHPDSKGMLALQGMLRLAALDMLHQVENGQADAALETCVDGLAVSRDLGHGSGLIGAMVSTAGVKILSPACARALQRASLPSVRAAIQPLRRIRRGLNPFSSTMREESVVAPLTFMGKMLDPEQVKALPDSARKLVTNYSSASSGGFPLFEPFIMRHALLELSRFDQRMVPLMDLPLALRKPRVDAMHRELSQSWNPVIQIAEMRYDRFAARADLQRAHLDLLLSLAQVRMHRAEHGEWPAALPPIDPEAPMPHPTALRLQPGAAGALEILPEDTLLRGLDATLGVDMPETSTLQVLATP